MRARLRQLYQKFPTSIQNLFHNGTPEILLGSSILFYVSYSFYMDNQQSKTRQRILLDDMIMQQKQQLNEETSTKTLYSSKVIIPIPASFDGFKCLVGVQLNDVVDIIEEDVGPGNRYHLCRLDSKIGWLPNSYLKRISD